MNRKKAIILSAAGLAVLLAVILLFSGNSDTSQRNAGDRAGSGPSFTQDEGSSGGLNLLDWLFSALGKKEDSDDPTKGADDPRYVKLIEGIDRLYENFGMLSKDKQDEKKLLLDQSALIIDYRLGPDHPKKKEFIEIVGWSHDQRQPINKKFMEGNLTQKELFEQLDTHFKDVAEKYAAIFTDEEYQLMFNIDKDGNLAAAMGLTPENAEALEERDKTPPKDNLAAADYAISEEETMTEDQIQVFRKTYGDPAGMYPEPKETEPK